MIQAVIDAGVLQQIPIFRNLTRNECDQIFSVASIVEVAQGQIVLQQGHRSQNLWIILEGQCEVFRVNGQSKPENIPKNSIVEKIVLAQLGPHNHFGEMSFFQSAPHSASVCALETGKLLCIKRADFDALIDRGDLAPYKLAFNVIDSLADRLRKMDQWVSRLVEHDNQDAVTPARQTSEWQIFRTKILTEWNL